MYPVDRRALASHVYAHVQSLRKAALLLNVSHTTIRRWLVAPQRTIYQRKSPKLSLIKDVVIAKIVDDPLLTLKALQRCVQDCIGVNVSKELVRLVLCKHGLTRKKARFYGCPKDLPAKTSQFLRDRSDVLSTATRVVSIDETSFGRNIGTAFGYSKRGSKIFIQRSRPRRTTQTVVACVGHDEMIHRKAMPASCNTPRFLQFLKECNLSPGTCVLLDNVSFHHAKIVKSWAVASGIRLLYTPPYSPWFNPIEACFSIVKRLYYKGETIDGSFEALRPEHYQAFFRKALNAVDRW